MPRRHLLKAALCACVLVLAACGGAAESPEGGTGATELSFIFPNDGKPGIIFYPYFVAEDLGFFEEENLTVTAIPSDGSSAATQQMVAGQADAGTPFSASVLEAFVEGLDTRYVYTYSTGQNFGITVPESSDFQSVEDLEGATIGISEADGGEVAVINAALTNVGLDPETAVEMIPIGEGNPATLAAIENGEVDAYASSGGDMLLLRARGLALRDITPDEFKNFPAHGISTTATVLEEKADALARFGRAYAKATLFCQTNRDACQTIMARLSPAEFEDPVLGETEMKRLLDITVVADGEQYGAPNREAWDAYNEFRLITEPDAELADLDTFLVDDLVDEYNDFDHEAIVELAENYTE
jgi:ABC-type nitrate/sulfonate/bicarbonate transport system substrate-binding protein